MGAVDKSQAYWIENARFVVLVSLFEQFEALINQFFYQQYLLISCAYSTNRCPEREIWWFLYRWQWQQRWQTDKPTALSLAHAHGVIKDSFMCTIIQQTSAPLLPPYSRHLPSPVPMARDIAKHNNKSKHCKLRLELYIPVCCIRIHLHRDVGEL